MAGCHTSRVVTVVNPQGMHLRPADMLVRLATQFEASINIVRDGDRFDGKSILSLMTLAAEQGTELVLEANGPDAAMALEALAELFGRGFDEMDTSQHAQDSS